jgi:hypothetical protein
MYIFVIGNNLILKFDILVQNDVIRAESSVSSEYDAPPQKSIRLQTACLDFIMKTESFSSAATGCARPFNCEEASG